ncbi:spore germination protein [Bacillus taeanensis]|uniref:Spore germination protein n=1 Tax=Bacillus taeanensis TaxID=273032 RepID=A0A366XYF2_9BACI|nr:spore germination protein [Bacillus taeanensis]RBW70175.1 hypothetical protein DS031_08280 [Bacillus taeanensis]
MPVFIGAVKIGGVQSGASVNAGEIPITSTHSKMNMQAQAGSFTVGDANLINNAGSGNLSCPVVNDPDALEVAN